MKTYISNICKKEHAITIIAASIAALQMGSAFAQTAAAANSGVLNLDEVVITAAPEARSKMKQSQSVSSMSSEQVTASGAVSAAEILRSIPGIRSEASSGDGNANITVRGVPISAGGARYVQLQEDGLPVLLFGDYNFATSDMFMRTDFGTDGVEAVRGGGASTLATNSPGGVINFLSKNGENNEGAIGVSTTLAPNAFKNVRLDLAKGGAINSTTRYQVSGYVRNGEGPRESSGAKEEGHQIRANITKDLGDGSYVRVNLKSLDDKSPTLLSVPVRIVNQQIVEAPGIDPRTYSPYSTGLRNVPNWGMYDGTSQNINEGLHVKSTAIGAEASLNLGDGWNLKDSFRIAKNSGIFSGVMPANSIGDASLPGYGKYDALFLGAKFNDLGLSVNDLKVNKKIKWADGTSLNATAGLFMASQNLNIDWEIGHFNLTSPSGTGVQTNAYESWYKRYIDLTYNHLAPYAALAYEAGPLNIDASVRADRQTVNGLFLGGSAPSTAHAANYKSNNTAYSLGANYQFNKDLSGFARTSSGSSFNSDRVLFTEVAACGNTCFVGQTVPVNKVVQHEVGVKARSGKLSTSATVFIAKTTESNYDLTTGQNSANTYDAKGVELEMGYKMGAFKLNGGLTYTDASVVASSTAAYVGKTPNRQAKMVYQIAPSVDLGNLNIGASIIGTTSSKDAQLSAYEATMAGYTYVNAFVKYDLTSNWSVNFSVNNLFNKIGYTEVNSDRAAARSINGRSAKLQAVYKF